jgi:hypothetical protein
MAATNMMYFIDMAHATLDAVNQNHKPHYKQEILALKRGMAVKCFYLLQQHL